MSATPEVRELLAALTALRERLAAARFPLAVEGAAEDARERDRLLGQLDDYVLPRLRRLGAPLLAVVGGSTGAGKSTLVNTIVGTVVSASGVLRPTTRGPVLVHHPDDAAWFADLQVLPHLPRQTGTLAEPGTLGLVSSPSLPPGLALLDAPDIDSVVAANRDLAAQLLAAADLWVFVTTAARYADAVPWDALTEASERSAAVAVILDRVPEGAAEPIVEDLTTMLRDNGLEQSPLFVIPEVTLAANGMLPPTSVESLKRWLTGLAADPQARAVVVRRTLEGTLTSYGLRVPALAARLKVQEEQAAGLRLIVDQAYADAVGEIDEAVRDGAMLRGEVLARWQEFVGSGELLRTLESRVGRLRDRFVAAVRGRPAPVEELSEALETGVETLVRVRADAAAERVARQWATTKAGETLLAAAGRTSSSRTGEDFAQRSSRAVRDWQGGVLDLVRREGEGRRTTARLLSYGVNGAALVVMVAVFSQTGGLTGGEVVVAGGASALGQKLLEALLGDQTVRTLAAAARQDLRARVEVLFDGERDRWLEVLDAAAGAGDSATAQELLAVERVVRSARDAEESS